MVYYCGSTNKSISCLIFSIFFRNKINIVFLLNSKYMFGQSTLFSIFVNFVAIMSWTQGLIKGFRFLLYWFNKTCKIFHFQSAFKHFLISDSKNYWHASMTNTCSDLTLLFVGTVISSWKHTEASEGESGHAYDQRT